MTVKLSKIEGTERFNHFIWRRHDDRLAWHHYRPEVVATDGRRIRRIVGQPHHLIFQQFIDPEAAQKVVKRIEDNTEVGEAFIGYSVFETRKSIALLHTGPGLEPGWVALPYNISLSNAYPTMPLKSGDHPTLRLIGGGSFVDDEGPTPYLRAVLEQRGERFKGTSEAFNILEHIVDWRVVAQLGYGEDAKSIRLARNDHTFSAKRREDFRLEKRFSLDPVFYREFKDDPEFRVFFEVKFDTELMCLPEEWLTYWFQIEFSHSKSKSSE